MPQPKKGPPPPPPGAVPIQPKTPPQQLQPSETITPQQVLQTPNPPVPQQPQPTQPIKAQHQIQPPQPQIQLNPKSIPQRQSETPNTPTATTSPPKNMNQCEIHIFDPKAPLNPISPPHSSIIVHPWGFKGSSIHVENNEYDFKSIQETIKLLGHEHTMIDVLLLDCNMCEWDIYPDLFPTFDDHHSDDESERKKKRKSHLHLPHLPHKKEKKHLEEIRMTSTFLQIVMKLHDTTPVVNDLFMKMKDNGYVIFHKETNAMSNGNHYDYSFLKLAPSFFEG